MANKTKEELLSELAEHQAWIDGPQNDGRLTTDSSANLDYHWDMIDEIKKELANRG